jgi:hypothetical protein
MKKQSRSIVDRPQRRVAVGIRVAPDAAADAVQIKVEGGELDVVFDVVDDPPDIKREWGDRRNVAPRSWMAHYDGVFGQFTILAR